MAHDLTPLSIAAEELEAFIAQLNDASTTCKCCNRVSYNDLTEARAKDELSGALGKIRRHLHAFQQREKG